MGLIARIDIINIICVTTFGVEHRFNDGFTYGQSFWLTVCSTIASTITNVTVIVDYVRTPQFSRSGAYLFNKILCFQPPLSTKLHLTGSGLTRKQRALVIIVIILRPMAFVVFQVSKNQAHSPSCRYFAVSILHPLFNNS